MYTFIKKFTVIIFSTLVSSSMYSQKITITENSKQQQLLKTIIQSSSCTYSIPPGITDAVKSYVVTYSDCDVIITHLFTSKNNGVRLNSISTTKIPLIEIKQIKFEKVKDNNTTLSITSFMIFSNESSSISISYDDEMPEFKESVEFRFIGLKTSDELKIKEALMALKKFCKQQ